MADLVGTLKRRHVAALGAGPLLAPRTAAAQSATGALRVFPPNAAPFDQPGRRQLAEDALLWLWELHGDRPGRPVFSLPRAAILGTRKGTYLPRWEMTVAAGTPIHLPAFIRTDRSHDPVGTTVKVDGVPLTLPAGAGWLDYTTRTGMTTRSSSTASSSGVRQNRRPLGALTRLAAYYLRRPGRASHADTATPRMQAVPLGFFLFLVELAAGGLIVTALLDWEGEVSGGFLFLNGIFMLGAAAVGVWLRTVLPAERLVPHAAGSPWVGAEVAAWASFAVMSAAYLFCVKTDRRSVGRAFGALAAAAGVAGIAVSALAYAPGATSATSATSAAPLFAALGAGALALGAAWSAMMLGHWYLVTPLLAPRPLLRLNAGLAGALALQAALAAWAVTGAALEPAMQWFLWLRVGAGVAMPLALTVPVWRTARVRSMMSATGLLYVALGLVLAGEIIAKSLFFLSDVPT